jgi:hypothetical protein
MFHVDHVQVFNVLQVFVQVSKPLVCFKFNLKFSMCGCNRTHVSTMLQVRAQCF